MAYIEEREFIFRIEANAEFPEDYDGDADGYAWVPELQDLVSEMLTLLVSATRRKPGWRVRPANRGRSSEDEITLVLEKTFE